MKMPSLLLLPSAALLLQVGNVIASAQSQTPSYVPALSPAPTQSLAQTSQSKAAPSTIPQTGNTPPQIAQTEIAQDAQNQIPAPPWAKDLNLSAEQRSRLLAVNEQAHKKGETLHQKLMEAEKQLRSLLQSDASIQQLRQRHQEVQQLRQQLDNNRFEALLGERQVLTPEQLTMVIQRFRKEAPMP